MIERSKRRLFPFQQDDTGVTTRSASEGKRRQLSARVILTRRVLIFATATRPFVRRSVRPAV